MFGKRLRVPTRRDLLLDLLESYRPYIKNGGKEDIITAYEVFKQAGIKSEMHMGKDKIFFDTDTEEGQTHTLEWYMGVYITFVDECNYASLIPWLNHFDEYTTFKNGGRTERYIN